MPTVLLSWVKSFRQLTTRTAWATFPLCLRFPRRLDTSPREACERWSSPTGTIECNAINSRRVVRTSFFLILARSSLAAKRFLQEGRRNRTRASSVWLVASPTASRAKPYTSAILSLRTCRYVWANGGAEASCATTHLSRLTPQLERLASRRLTPSPPGSPSCAGRHKRRASCDCLDQSGG